MSINDKAISRIFRQAREAIDLKVTVSTSDLLYLLADYHELQVKNSFYQQEIRRLIFPRKKIIGEM